MCSKKGNLRFCDHAPINLDKVDSLFEYMYKLKTFRTFTIGSMKKHTKRIIILSIYASHCILQYFFRMMRSEQIKTKISWKSKQTRTRTLVDAYLCVWRRNKIRLACCCICMMMLTYKDFDHLWQPRTCVLKNIHNFE